MNLHELFRIEEYCEYVHINEFNPTSAYCIVHCNKHVNELGQAPTRACIDAGCIHNQEQIQCASCHANTPKHDAGYGPTGWLCWACSPTCAHPRLIREIQDATA